MTFIKSIPAGPWKALYSGVYEGYDVDIIMNEEFDIISILYLPNRKSPEEVVLAFFKPLYCEGEMEIFTETFPKKLHFFMKKTDDNGVKKYLIIEGAHQLLKATPEFISKNADKEIKNLHSTVTIVKDISKAYGIKIWDFKIAKEEDKKEFFSDPKIVLFFSPKILKRIDFRREEKRESEKKVLLGNIKGTKNWAEEHFLLLKDIFVYGMDEKERRKVIHILVEGASISGMPIVLFDFQNKYDTLSYPNKNIDSFNLEPIGLPVKEFYVKKDVFISFSALEGNELVEEYGIGSDRVGEKLTNLIKTHGSKIMSFKELYDLNASDGLSGYDFFSMQRILKYFELHFDDFYHNKNDIKEIYKIWGKKFGRIGRIVMDELETREKRLLTLTLLKELLVSRKSSEDDGNNKESSVGIVVLPEVGEILKKECVAKKEIIKTLTELKKYGIFAVTSANTILDIPKEYWESITTKLAVVGKNDVSISIKERKPYRVLLRPTLTKIKDD